MRFSSPKARAFALLLALALALFPAAALALLAEPAAGETVRPGDTIAYTFTLPDAMENCVLRLSLSPGLTLQEGSVQVHSQQEAEIVYGSDGFVLMADALAAGDTVTFVAEVSQEALEVWARMTAAGGSISEEDGYVAHQLAPDQPESLGDTAASPAPSPAAAASSPRQGGGLYVLLLLLFPLGGGAYLWWRRRR